MNEGIREFVGGLWPHVRAALIAFHLAAVTLMALPAPGGGTDTKQWTDPTVQAELKAWNARLALLGWSMPQDVFEQRLATSAKGLMKARDVALKPFRPYYKYAFTDQSWRMFVAPHTFPERMHIDVEEDGVWRPLYIERDPEHAWHAEVFDHDRVRSMIFRFAWQKYRTSYGQFADWVQRLAKAEFPEATRIRLRFYKQRTPSPEEVRAGIEPEGSWNDEMVRALKPKSRAGTP